MSDKLIDPRLGDWIQLDPHPDCIRAEEAIKRCCEYYKIPPLGGPSGIGWSYHSAIQTCPRKFYYNSLPIDGNDFLSVNEYFEVGSFVHFLLAIYYAKRAKRGIFLNHQFHRNVDGLPSPEGVRDFLFAENVNVALLEESWGYFEGYQDHYFREDWLMPLAVEFRKEIVDENGEPFYSCRYDLIAKIIEPNDLSLPAGTYWVDHKTASRLDNVGMDYWIHTGEVNGQMLCWSGLDKKFGELRGSIINIIGKQKDQKFHRTPIPVQDHLTERFRDDIKYWKSQIKEHEQLKTWPRAEANCIGRYGPCDHYLKCW
jgi:hypothetical protein